MANTTQPLDKLDDDDDTFFTNGGDVVLRSADDTDFLVHRLILTQGSPVFADMFSIPTPVAEKDHVQIVRMEEPASVISVLVKLCYPMDDPVLGKLDTLRPVLNAMVKYQMDGVKSGWISRMLSMAARKEPWGVYATALSLGRISCNYRMEKEVRLGARYILRLSGGGGLGSMVEEMRLISGADYHRVLLYYQKCCEKGSDVLTGARISETIGTDWVWMKPCAAGRCRQTLKQMVASPNYLLISEWWVTYMDRAKTALAKQPWGYLVENEELWADLVRKMIDDCPQCAKAAFTQMPTYAKRLSRAMECELSQVQLQIEW